MLEKLDKFSPAEIEEKVLAFWKARRVFERSVAARARGPKRKEFVFYEGPPTANGHPGIHHVVARAFKDVVLRYKTMAGFHAPRKGGWDTHGLPVELGVEKQLGLRSKKEIERYGVAAFNRKCRESVWQYKDEWERLTERMGYWLDLEHAYITYENSYMETLWWIFRRVAEKKLFYEGHKVVPWCPRCGTALSSHEVAQGYREVTETSVFVKFRLLPGQAIKNWTVNGATFVLSWTTTPWTLPGNVALAVGREIEYLIVETEGAKGSETCILAAPRIGVLDGVPHRVLRAVKGKDLVGLSYEPLFSVPAIAKDAKAGAAYKVYAADFVTTEDGTGVVHTAVMYGEDDYELGTEVGLPEVHTVDEEGKFIRGVPGLAGLSVKSKEAQEKIFSHLKIKNLLLKTEEYTHEYPFCWRCGSALLYYARHSWFIGMSALRGALRAGNETVNWVPAHLKEGRFGEWLKEAKDWAISRERYWGTPLPVWRCDACGETKVLGSVAELDGLVPSRRNRYIVMRHGEAENNTRHLINNWPEPVKLPLTPKGRKQVEASAKRLRKEGIDMVFASDVTRTKETAEIVRAALDLPKVRFDPRLREFDMGGYNGKTYEEYKNYYASRAEKFTKRTPHGENFTDLRTRLYDFLQSVERDHEGETILIVTHDAPVYMLHSILMGWSTEDALAEKNRRGEDYIGNAGFEMSGFRGVPRDETGAFDLHRPFIDAMTFPCPACGGKGTMRRVPEVADVWFDSGAMPFAQAHFPFEQMANGKRQAAGNKKQKTDVNMGSAMRALPYPADYISEAVDQTRGWFYTLLAVATLLGREAPYRNVISLGLVLDKNGQKMSKSKGNIVDPWDMIQKYGVDAVRWYCYTVNPPGEPKRFDEADLAKVSRQFFQILYNSHVFYRTYADQRANGKGQTASKNVLDRWVLVRLAETRAAATAGLDAYDIGSAAKAIESFADDLSRWYIRRSRRRLQRPDATPEGKRDFGAASATLRGCLLGAAALVAPFAPFFADALYCSLPGHGKESVHLEDWIKNKEPKIKDKKLLADMAEVRMLASAVLAKRAELGIKVRQPLGELKLKGAALKGKEDLLEILKDEVNVKEVSFDPALEGDFELDTEITHELREEGWLRELVRTVQGLRQDAKLEPKDRVTLFVEAGEELASVLERNAASFKKDIGAKTVEFKRTDRFKAELATKVDGMDVWLALRK